MGKLIALLAVFWLTGCASNLPEPIRQEPESNPELKEVLDESHSFVGREVRWGGTVASVQNLADSTLLELVERPLDSSGHPWNSDDTDGRFLVKVDGFLDPEIYARGRDVTVRGVIEGEQLGSVGQYPYRYVLIKGQALHLWEKQSERRIVHDPWPYGYGDPLYLYRPWPYWPYYY